MIKQIQTLICHKGVLRNHRLVLYPRLRYQLAIRRAQLLPTRHQNRLRNRKLTSQQTN